MISGKNIFGKNLRRLRKMKGLTQKELAEVLGVTITSVGNWELGRSFPPIGGNSMQQLSEFFDVKASVFFDESFFTFDFPRDAIRAIADDSAYVEVPLYGKIAAGEPIEMLEDSETFKAPMAFIEKYPRAFYLITMGYSMDRIIPDRSYVLIDPDQIDVISGQIYAITINGYDATIKKLECLNNGMRLIPMSSDPTYETITLDFGKPETEELRIIGRVIWATFPLDYLIG